MNIHWYNEFNFRIDLQPYEYFGVYTLPSGALVFTSKEYPELVLFSNTLYHDISAHEEKDSL